MPKYYIEPLTHRLTSVSKKVPCLSKFFARYKDIFGQWFSVTPHIATTEPSGKLDLKTIQKKVRFDTFSDMDLSRGGVYDPDAVDDLISWLEGFRRQDVEMHQLADQVGSLNPGEYITPKLMLPSHTLPGGSWHSFILGKLWGAIRGLGEIFSSIFGLLIGGRLIWYVVKVLMNCSYIHSAHGCSAKLAWSFCTEVVFTRNYRREQRQQGATSERSDNDPSNQPKPTMRDRMRSFASCECMDSLCPVDSDEELRNSTASIASRIDLRDILRPSSTNLRRQVEALNNNQRL